MSLLPSRGFVLLSALSFVEDMMLLGLQLGAAVAAELLGWVDFGSAGATLVAGRDVRGP